MSSPVRAASAASMCVSNCSRHRFRNVCSAPAFNNRLTWRGPSRSRYHGVRSAPDSPRLAEDSRGDVRRCSVQDHPGDTRPGNRAALGGQTRRSAPSVKPADETQVRGIVLDVQRCPAARRGDSAGPRPDRVPSVGRRPRSRSSIQKVSPPGCSRRSCRHRETSPWSAPARAGALHACRLRCPAGRRAGTAAWRSAGMPCPCPSR